VNRLKEPEHFGEQLFVYRLVDVGNIGMDMLRVRRADERGRDVRMRARILDGQLDDVDTSCPAKRNGFAATLDNCFARRVPSRRSARGQGGPSPWATRCREKFSLFFDYAETRSSEIFCTG